MPLKILFLTYDLPYPLNSGGKIRAYYFLKSLAKNNKITLFSYYRSEEQKEHLSALGEYCEKIQLFKRNKVWAISNFIRTFSSKIPFTAAIYYSEEMKESLLKETSMNNYDLVFFESFYPAVFMPLLKNKELKVVMGNENIEYKVYERLANQKKKPISELMKIEISKMRRFEENLWRQADLNLVVTAQDGKVVNKITGKKPVIIPNGVDFPLYGKISPDRKSHRIIFIGNLLYQANSDAIKYFLLKSFPLVRKEDKSVKLVIISGYHPTWIDRFVKKGGVELIQDKVTPAREFLKTGAVFIAPMRVGGGTNIKILEAMAAGLPVVTTQVGNEGINAKVNKEVIITDDPENFSRGLLDLLQNENKNEIIGQAGKNFVGKNYDWENIGKALDVAIKSVKNDN